MAFISLLMMPFVFIGGMVAYAYNSVVTAIFTFDMKSDVSQTVYEEEWKEMPLIQDEDGGHGSMNEIEIIVRQYMEKAAEAINSGDDEALTELYGEDFLTCNIHDDSSTNYILTSQAERFITSDIGKIVNCTAVKEKCMSKTSRSDEGDFAGLYRLTGESGDRGYLIINISDNQISGLIYIIEPCCNEDEISLMSATYMGADISIFMNGDFDS